MSRTKVNEQSMFAVCDRIFIETGRDPTYEELATEFDCSNSTVKPILHSWLKRPRPARHPMPEKLSNILGTYLQIIWGHALSAGVEAVLPNKEEMQAGLMRCQEQLSSALQIIEEKEEGHSRQQAEIRSLMQQLAALQVQVDNTAVIAVRCNELEKLFQAMRQERDEANERSSNALGQLAANERHIAALLNSLRTESTASRTTRRRKPAHAATANE
jgi:hypothetical protein